MVVANVNVLALDHQDVLVRSSLSAISDHRTPGDAEVVRLRDFNKAFAVLQPRCVHGATIGGVNLDLHINLSRPGIRNQAWVRPSRAVVVAHNKEHGRTRTARASWYGGIGNSLILGNENVDVSESVGGDRRFPLITNCEAHAGLRLENWCGCRRRVDGQQHAYRGKTHSEKDLSSSSEGHREPPVSASGGHQRRGR